MNDDEQMRALFNAVGKQPGPPLGVTADGIARGGRRVRLARWGAGAAASLVVAGALTVTIALSANRNVEPGSPPPAPPEITTTDVPTTPTVRTTTTEITTSETSTTTGPPTT